MKNFNDKAETADLVDPDNADIIEKSRATANVITELDSEIFGDLKIELTAVLGHGAITVNDLVNLKSGELVSLKTPLNGLVDLKFKDRIVARGEIVSVGDHFGVRITEIVIRA